MSTESIWNSFDQKAKESQVHRTSTVEATIEVRRYFEEAVILLNGGKRTTVVSHC